MGERVREDEWGSVSKPVTVCGGAIKVRVLGCMRMPIRMKCKPASCLSCVGDKQGLRHR